MKLLATVLFAVLVLFAIYSEIEAQQSKNCEGTSDRRCPQVLCGPDGPKGWLRQDNSKPYPQCCGRPICS